ncbi:MAG: hypothetical protein E6R03_11945 [Hyphomicrobiaceae bacterium]|nr:MAG: hypothetical protein E6R03_11945 [Hyphomicrobiaceae bacterium]
METIWKALGDGGKVLIDATVATLLAVVTNPIFIFSLPAIYGAMYVFKQVTPFLRKSKAHDAVYTIAPILLGSLYAETLTLFPSYFKLNLGHPQILILGAGLGIVNILVYKLIRWWQNKKKKEEKKP